MTSNVFKHGHLCEWFKYVEIYFEIMNQKRCGTVFFFVMGCRMHSPATKPLDQTRLSNSAWLLMVPTRHGMIVRSRPALDHMPSSSRLLRRGGIFVSFWHPPRANVRSQDPLFRAILHVKSFCSPVLVASRVTRSCDSSPQNVATAPSIQP